MSILPGGPEILTVPCGGTVVVALAPSRVVLESPMKKSANSDDAGSGCATKYYVAGLGDQRLDSECSLDK